MKTRSTGDPTLAFVTPYPPQATGIADYSAELLPALSAALEGRLRVELVVEDSTTRLLGGATGPGGIPVTPLSALPEHHRRGRYAAVLYHLGNNARFHGEIYRCLMGGPRLGDGVPGIVVLHEYVLHHLVAGVTLGSGASSGAAAFAEELRYAYGGTGRSLGERFLRTGVPLDPWTFPLFERIVDRSRGVIVHNETSRRRILASRPEAEVLVVPSHLCLPTGAEAAAPRELLARLGVPAGALVVAAFGYITPEKRPDLAIRAFHRLRRSHPQAVFLLVGEVAPDIELESLLAEGRAAGGEGGGVRVTGRLEMPDFLAAMRACDIAINLRDPTGGETSATLIRLLGLGKAVVVSQHGSFAEIPMGCAAPLEMGRRPEVMEEELVALLRALAGDPELRLAMGAAARRHIARHHTLEGSARAYAELALQVIAEDRWPPPAVPPLAPHPPEDLLAGLCGALGGVVADLLPAAEEGATDAAEVLSAHLASTLVELGLDLPGGDHPSRLRGSSPPTLSLPLPEEGQ